MLKLRRGESATLSSGVLENLDSLCATLAALPHAGLGNEARIMCGAIVLDAMWRIAADQNADPEPPLSRALAQCGELATALQHLAGHVEARASSEVAGSEHALTKGIFEAAWTSYDDPTYEHSVELIIGRLAANGFDESWFRDKTCFDGGCGTGRFSVAMARLGARKVIAADIGTQSLEFFRDVLERQHLDTVEVREMDVTDLAPIPAGSFDFVASHGVLHHTANPERGIREHLRITKRGGLYWLYLYGAGGIYWEVFDRLRPAMREVTAREIRRRFEALELRRGLIYTFLDNFLAPRVYYRRQQVIDLLRQFDPVFIWKLAKGTSPIDDSALSLATRYGSAIWGPDGEIRLLIERQ